MRRLLNFPKYWKAAMLGMKRVIQERGMPDLCHVHIMVRPAMVALAMKRRHGIPYILSEQSSEYLDGSFDRKGRLFKLWNRYLFAKASAVTAVSDWLGEGLVKAGLTGTFNVVPNVVPGLDRPLPAAGDPDHFMVVADLVDKTKNVSGVINALHKARREKPGLRLTIIGDGPDRPMLEDLARSLQLNGSVEFLGRLPNTGVLEHMSRAGSVIINSNVETFSVVTGEALALGRPVIATRCGGPAAFINSGNGILIGIRDTEALERSMVELSGKHGNYAPDRIRATVSERFSYEAVGHEFMKIYQRVLDHG
jgi:alpha-maltose-1-phosphate synthase